MFPNLAGFESGRGSGIYPNLLPVPPEPRFGDWGVSLCRQKIPEPLLGGRVIDFRAIRDGADLLEIARGYTTLSGNRREPHGPCPICGGEDRFYLRVKEQRWFCRRCREQGGDVLDLIQAVQGADLARAIEILGAGKFARMEPKLESRKAVEKARHPAWESYATKEVETAHACLLGPEGVEGREYLKSRGIGNASLCCTYRLGFNPAQGYGWDPKEKRYTEQRPAIVIPWLNSDGTVRGLRYRFTDDAAKSRRVSCKRGSKWALFGLHALANRDTLAIIEGEINALSVALACQDCDVLSTGSDSGHTQVDESVTVARRYARVLVWMDEPEKAAGIAYRIGEVAFPISSPQGMDANAILCAYGHEGLARFVLLALEPAPTRLKPPANPVCSCPQGAKAHDYRHRLCDCLALGTVIDSRCPVHGTLAEQQERAA